MRITAVIKPNQRHRQGVRMDDGIFYIFTKSPAIEGRANSEALRLLAAHFQVSQSCIKLAHGQKSRHKIFDVQTRSTP